MGAKPNKRFSASVVVAIVFWNLFNLQKQKNGFHFIVRFAEYFNFRNFIIDGLRRNLVRR